MSLYDLASVGSFISGLAVAVTLIFLVLQMRQADRNQRATMQLGLADRATDLLSRMSDPEFASVLLKARTRPEEMSELELQIAFNFIHNLFVSWHSSFLHYKAGLLDEGSMAMEDSNVRGALSAPAFRAFWRLSRSSYSEEFRDHIDNVIANQPPYISLELGPVFRPLLQEQMAQAVPVPSGDGAFVELERAFTPAS